MTRNAFTLVELLVVITIIVVLLALLVPGMDGAIEATHRAVCAANQRVWGSAFLHYAQDNRNSVVSTVKGDGDFFHGRAPFPNVAWVYTTMVGQTNPHEGEWALQTMKPYAAVVQSGRMSGLWYCPSGNPALNKEFNEQQAVAPNTPLPQYANPGPAVASHYAYFGRADAYGTISGQPFAPFAQDLLGKRMLDSTRLMMSDSLSQAAPHGELKYNHGEPSTGEPSFAGTNQMRGDLSVHWKHPYNRYALWTRTQPEAGHYVRTAGGGPGWYYY